MASIAQLGYLGLGVSDIAAWENYATNVLGFQVSDRAEGALYLRMDEYHHRIVVHPGGNDDLAYVGWEVVDEQSMRELGDQLRAAGIRVSDGSPEEAEARRVAGLIKFQDPNGIAEEIFFGPLINFESPFHSPRAISGFETGEQGLGHFVIAVNDYAESMNFYRDVLGMRISDFIEIQPVPGFKLKITFFHCNPRHHTLAFIAAPLPKRLAHFMVQLKSLDDVGATYYQCQDQGVPITMSFGRHTNDHMVSFYMQTPSGFDVEYGWGAREVDDAVWHVQTHQATSIWGHRRMEGA